MKKIIGYTDFVTECECCGKIDLKGTYCLEIDGVELYYGSVCAFKNHGISKEEQKDAKVKFTKEQKNKLLYSQHIAPLEVEKSNRLKNGFTCQYSELTDLAKKIYNQIETEYNRVIQLRANKYKIQLP
jgi:uncharacterized membrane protein